MEFLDTDIFRIFKIISSSASQVSLPEDNAENLNCLDFFLSNSFTET